MNKELWVFDVVSSLCFSCGMTKRETAFFLASGGTVPPFEYELKRWRDHETYGTPLGSSLGCLRLLYGKSRIESTGSMCSGYTRMLEYFKGENQTMAWEGTYYWDQFPLWYTEIVLSWHPRYGGRND